jgi:hypothetical protein
MTASRPKAASFVRIAAAVAAPLALHSPVSAESPDASWQFAVTPYLWIPSVSSSLRFETPGESPVALNDHLKNLKAALFVAGEARKGPWSLAFDLVYCGFSSASSKVSSVTGPGGVNEVPVNSGTDTGLTGTMISLEGVYSLLRVPDATFDLLAGLRSTHISSTLNWSFETPVDSLPGRTGSVSRGVDLWDGVVGFRGDVLFGQGKWFVPYYLDAGAGTSRFTWQGVIGFGYSFGWGDLRLVYRYLSFEQGNDQFVQRLSLAGPALGATFHF